MPSSRGLPGRPPQQPADGFLRAVATGEPTLAGMASRSVPSTSIESDCDSTLERREEDGIAGRAARLVDGQGIVAERGGDGGPRAPSGTIHVLWRLRGTHRLHDRGPVPIGGGRCVPLARSHTPAGLLDVAGRRPRAEPLFANLADEAPPPLPRLSPAQEVIHDYHAQGLSLRGHPFAPLRPSLGQRNGSCRRPRCETLKAEPALSSRRPGSAEAAAGNRQGNHVHDDRR